MRSTWQGIALAVYVTAMTDSVCAQPTLLGVKSDWVDPAPGSLEVIRFDKAKAPQFLAKRDTDWWDEMETTAETNARAAVARLDSISNVVRRASISELIAATRDFIADQTISQQEVKLLRKLKPDEEAAVKKKAEEDATRMVLENPERVRTALVAIAYEKAVSAVRFQRFLKDARQRAVLGTPPTARYDGPVMRASTRENTAPPRRPIGPTVQPTPFMYLIQGVPYALDPARMSNWQDAMLEYERQMEAWRRLPPR